MITLFKIRGIPKRKKGAQRNMKQRNFFIACIAVHLLFFIVYIHKNSSYIKLSFQQQKLDEQKKTILKNKELLLQKLCLMQNKNSIKAYALKELKMEPLKLNAIKTIPTHV